MCIRDSIYPLTVIQAIFDGKCKFEPYKEKHDIVDMVVNTTYPYSYNMPVIGCLLYTSRCV